MVELISLELDYSLYQLFNIFFPPHPFPPHAALLFFFHSWFIKPLLICLMWQMRGGSWWTGNGKVFN